MPKRVTLKSYDTFDISTFVLQGDTVYISHFGESFDDAGNKLIGVEEQALQAFKNLETALKEINLSLRNLMKVTVILRDIADFDQMHDVWKKVFEGGYPVRTTITSDFVDAHCRIQLEGIACLD